MLIYPKKKILFLDRIFRQKISHQANFIEVLGWVGIMAFFYLVVYFLTVKIDIGVPAQAISLSDERPSLITIDFEMNKEHFPKLHVGQSVLIDIQLLAKNTKLEGKVALIDSTFESTICRVSLDPVVLNIKDIGEMEKTPVRLIIDRKSLVNVLMGDMTASDFLM